MQVGGTMTPGRYHTVQAWPEIQIPSVQGVPRLQELLYEIFKFRTINPVP